MSNYLFVSMMVVFLVVSGCGDNNGGPFEPDGDDDIFFPLAVGNQWTYDRAGTITMTGDSIGYIAGECVNIITGTANHSGGFEVFVQSYTVTDTTFLLSQIIIADTTIINYIRVTGDGLFGYAHLEDTDSTFTVPFPLQVGNTWQFSTEPPMIGEVLSLTTTVPVIAGSFKDCLEMNTVWTDSGFILTNTTDFAPDIGKVKNLYVQSTSEMVFTIMDELQSYALN